MGITLRLVTRCIMGMLLKDEIHQSIEPEDKKFLEDHPEINASGVFRQALKKFREQLTG